MSEIETLQSTGLPTKSMRVARRLGVEGSILGSVLGRSGTLVWVVGYHPVQVVIGPLGIVKGGP